LMNRQDVGNPDKRDGVGPCGTHLAPVRLEGVRAGIGAAIRTIHSDVLRAEIPTRFASC